MVVGLEVVGRILALRLLEVVVFFREPRYEVKQSFRCVSAVYLSFCVCVFAERTPGIHGCVFIFMCAFINVCLFTRVVKW